MTAEDAPSAALDLTLNAGHALRNDLGLSGNTTVDELIDRHAHVARFLRSVRTGG